jgi:hypothetical protein
MPRVEYIPRVEVLRFARECEKLLAVTRANDGLTAKEKDALEAYVEALRALISHEGRRKPAA